MLQVYQSNQLDLLSKLLANRISQAPQVHPFQPETILVQNPGMAQWLKQNLASELGVSANIDFPLPSTFIWRCFTEVLPDVPAQSAFNKAAMTWKLAELLPHYLHLDAFAPLARYLDQADPLKWVQLAEKIADIYDQYLVYRPQWIAYWEGDGQAISAQEAESLAQEQPWQPILWRALVDKTAELGQSPYHRANLYQRFIDALQSGQGAALKRYGRIFVFGISALPPRYLEALAAMGEVIDVHLMVTNPCRQYWGDIRDQKYLDKRALKTLQQADWLGQTSAPKMAAPISLTRELMAQQAEMGHPLLASWGKQGRDYQQMISELEAADISAYVDLNRDTLLHALQADMLDLTTPQVLNNDKQAICMTDDSMHIAQCHSPLREVEVLHDYLLKQFDHNPHLSPRDVIVMVADIERYGPAVQAVFGSASGKRYIPFSLSDRSAQHEHPMLQTFAALLQLPNQRCTAPTLLEWLETAAVLRRFELSEQDFATLSQWVDESGIRWGLSQTAAQWQLPPQHEHSWGFGIKRMLLGYAMPSGAGLYHGALGYDEVEGLGAALAGKLAWYVETLERYHQLLQQSHSSEQWQQLLSQLLQDCFLPDADEQAQLLELQNLAAQLVAQRQSAGIDTSQDMLPLSVVQHYFSTALGQSQVSQRFLAGQVNVCTLMPMRAIPFKLVCLLGMNDGDYPRTLAPMGFDLMAGRAKAGDRSRRDDDRYLFLEAILAAQEKLYISYIGQSVLDNQAKVPSILLSELLEYLQQHYVLDKAGKSELNTGLADDALSQDLLSHLCQRYALSPFDAKAFEQGSYAAEWLPAANRQGQAAPEFLSQPLPPRERPETLELAELQRFWQLPVQSFFQRQLRVDFRDQLQTLEEREPFAIDTLASFQLKNTLLQAALSAQKIDEAFIGEQRARCQAAGLLPAAHFGALAFQSHWQAVEALLPELLPMMQHPLPDLEVDSLLMGLADDDQHLGLPLQGWVSGCYQIAGEPALLRYRVGSVRGQDLLRSWLEQLALAQQGVFLPVYWIGEKGSCQVSAPSAGQTLLPYVSDYLQGSQAPLAYFPRSCWAWLEAALGPLSDNPRGIGFDPATLDEKTQEKAQKALLGAFEDNFIRQGEGRDPYIARVWPQWHEALEAELQQRACQVLLPIYQQMQIWPPESTS